MSDDPIPCPEVEEVRITGYCDADGNPLTPDEVIDNLSAWGRAEEALADDLAHWLDVFVDHDHDEAMAVLARYREARHE